MVGVGSGPTAPGISGRQQWNPRVPNEDEPMHLSAATAFPAVSPGVESALTSQSAAPPPRRCASWGTAAR